MKVYKQFLGLLFVVGLILSLSACDDDDAVEDDFDPEKSKSLVDSANQELEAKLFDLIESELDNVEQPSDINFSTPNSLYKQALQFDPNNDDANFGAALTELLNLTQNQSFINAFETWGAFLDTAKIFSPSNTLDIFSVSPTGFPTSLSNQQMSIEAPLAMSMGMFKLTASSNVPQIGDIQNIFKAVALPAVNYSITRLERITNTSYIFTVTGKMQGDINEDAIEIDFTEIYALKSVLNILKSWLHLSVAYNFNIATYDSTGMVNALKQDSDFLALNSDGVSHMSSAKTALLAAATNLENAIAFVEAETDNQDDDVIKVGSGVPQEVKDGITEFKEALNGTVKTIKADFNGDNSLESLDVDFASYFDTPIQNFKALVPAYTVIAEIENGERYYWNSMSVSAIVTGDSSYKHYNRYHQISNGKTTSNQWGETISEFDSQFDALKDSLINNSIFYDYLYMSLNWWGYPNGPTNISATINYEYNIQTEYYVPVITWDATSFDNWILPDPTFNGLFPGMTDAQFKQTFNINASDVEFSPPAAASN